MTLAFEHVTPYAQQHGGYRTSVEWAKHEDDTLRAGIEAGLSASQIARELPGRSRNSVIGRCNRLGLTTARALSPDEQAARKAASDERRRQQRNARNRERYALGLLWPQRPRSMIHPNDEPNEDFDNDPSIGVSLLELKPDQCRFIAGDARDPKPYCGQPVMTESGPCRYCKFHFRRVYRPRA